MRLGRLPTVAFSRQYDELGNRTQLKAKIGSAEDFQNDYTYDNLSRLTKVTQQDWGGNTVADKRVDLTYNLAGQFDTITRYVDLTGTHSVVTSSYSYDGTGRISNLVHDKAGHLLGSYGLEYDEANRLTRVENGLTNFGTIDFEYDGIGQLEVANHALGSDESYTYDDNGNRESSGATSYTVGTNNQLSSDGVYNYTYDDEGNTETRTKISDSSFTLYTWDYRNRLVSVTSKTSSSGSVTQKINYTYDVFDRMVGRDVDSDGDTDIDVADRYIYDGGEIVLSLATNGDVKQRMLWGPGVDMALADENGSGGVYWTLGDQQNSIRGWAVYYDHLIGDVNGDDVVNQLDIDTVTGNWLMTGATLADGDANGDGIVNQLDINMITSNWLGTGTDTAVLAGQASYKAFGQGSTPTNIDILSIGYTGKFYEVLTGLQYNMARWYNSSTGRWISEDPIGFAGDPSNLGRYVGNGPTNGTDPSGLRNPDEDAPWPAGGGAPISGQISDWEAYNQWKDSTCPLPPRSAPPTNPATTVWTGKQGRIVNLTASAGSDPTEAQLWDAIHRLDVMYNGNSTAALGAIIQIRDSGTDNPLLAALDHYYNAKSAVENSYVPGLMFDVTLIANAGYSCLKAIGFPVKPDSKFPPSEVTWLQWMAGNWGAAAGYLSAQQKLQSEGTRIIKND